MLHGAGIFIYIYPQNDPNVSKYYIHGASGNVSLPCAPFMNFRFDLVIVPGNCWNVDHNYIEHLG